MRQGSGNSSRGQGKPSIISHAVSPMEVARFGQAQSPQTKPAPECKTIGVSAPKTSVTVHHCGSQGKR